ncbi:MAG: hypothetical protein IPM34_12640 [Saprospiraceae bacterium]|nr:hypothetical protein [Saprospiraceae bacterium]
MKTISLKIDDTVFVETDKILDKIKIPRNRYINLALAYYNSIQRKSILEEQLLIDSKLVRKESMNVLNDFEQIEDERSAM